MRYQLENEQLKVEIDTHGAELKSVVNQSTGLEYMWQADAKYWGRTSPVLFPVVGSVKNKEIKVDGVAYPMSQHGFARDNEFELKSQTDNEIWFTFTENEETLKKYPFRFILELGYRLIGRTLSVLWTVKNPDTKEMYFSIGAHPGFNCPIHGEADKTGYKIVFEGCDQIHHYGIGSDALCADEDLVLPLEDHRAVITKEFFDRCVFIVEGNQTHSVGVETPEGKRYLTVNFPNMELFGVWSPEKKDAPFFCIEPWCGRADASSFEGELKDRKFSNTLKGGETFETSYELVFGELE